MTSGNMKIGRNGNEFTLLSKENKSQNFEEIVELNALDTISIEIERKFNGHIAPEKILKLFSKYSNKNNVK